MALPVTPARPPDRQTTGPSRTAATIGIDATFGTHEGLVGPPRGSLYAGSSAQSAKSAQTKPKSAAVQGQELNIVANFPSPYGGLNGEIKAMADGRWEPTTDDFAAVAGKSAQTCDHFQNLLAAILFTTGGTLRPAHSVGRINIFTHANPGMIAFQGRLHPLSIGPPEVLLGTDGALDSAALELLNASGFNFTVPGLSKKTFTLDDVRKRFTSTDAQVFLYACHSAVDTALLADLADTLQATVVGFSGQIAYCPSFTTSPPAIMQKIGIDNCKKAVANFHDLADSDPGNVVTKKPSPSP